MRPPSFWNFCGSRRNSTISLQVFLGFVDAGDVLEGDAALRLVEQLGLRLAEAHRLAGAALHLTDEEHPDANDEKHRQPIEQHAEQRHAVVGLGVGRVDVVLAEQRPQRRVVARHHRGKRRVVAQLALGFVTLDGDFLDVALLHFGQEGRIAERRRGSSLVRPLKQIEQEHQEQRDQNPQRQIAEVVQGSPFSGGPWAKTKR
jgi:hypothetical protein